MHRQITLASRPQGWPSEDNFKLVESPTPSPGDGQFLAQVLWLSVDPYMRGRMNEAKSYAEPVGIGEVMVGGTVARVIESRHPRFQAGDIIESMFGWQEYAVSDGSMCRKIDTSLGPVRLALGPLGMPGMTAYFGLLEICQPRAGETVVVSGAAGAVGSYVGQIAHINRCRVVGIAGSDAKVDWLVNDLGFDAAMNYKTHTEYTKVLAQLCPNGIDCYFDNVGGAISDAVWRLINVRARIAICGQISQYNLDKPEMGPRLTGMLLIRQAKAEGFLVFQFADRFDTGRAQMAEWIRTGQLKYRESVAVGIENAPRAFLAMLRGENTGKQLVKIAEE